MVVPGGDGLGAGQGRVVVAREGVAHLLGQGGGRRQGVFVLRFGRDVGHLGADREVALRVARQSEDAEAGEGVEGRALHAGHDYQVPDVGGEVVLLDVGVVLRIGERVGQLGPAGGRLGRGVGQGVGDGGDAQVVVDEFVDFGLLAALLEGDALFDGELLRAADAHEFLVLGAVIAEGEGNVGALKQDARVAVAEFPLQRAQSGDPAVDGRVGEGAGAAGGRRGDGAVAGAAGEGIGGRAVREYGRVFEFLVILEGQLGGTLQRGAGEAPGEVREGLRFRGDLLGDPDDGACVAGQLELHFGPAGLCGVVRGFGREGHRSLVGPARKRRGVEPAQGIALLVEDAHVPVVAGLEGDLLGVGADQRDVRQVGGNAYVALVAGHAGRQRGRRQQQEQCETKDAFHGVGAYRPQRGGGHRQR